MENLLLIAKTPFFLDNQTIGFADSVNIFYSSSLHIHLTIFASFSLNPDNIIFVEWPRRIP